MSEKKTGFAQKLKAELKTFVVLFFYLALLLGGFTNYRRLLSPPNEIGWFHFGYSALEALILAKVVLIARMMKLGKRFDDDPLIIPTLVKTLYFGLFILAFSILERVVEGLFKGVHLSDVPHEILSQGLNQILAKMVVLVTALVPMLVINEIARYLGEGALFNLFFRHRERTPSPE